MLNRSRRVTPEQHGVEPHVKYLVWNDNFDMPRSALRPSRRGMHATIFSPAKAATSAALSQRAAGEPAARWRQHEHIVKHAHKSLFRTPEFVNETVSQDLDGCPTQAYLPGTGATVIMKAVPPE